MTPRLRSVLVLLAAAAPVAGALAYLSRPPGAAPARAAAAAVPLKDAKLNIEHNATDGDTGVQGLVDGEGWTRLDVRGPGGDVLAVAARGSLSDLGLTELFFESVEPENARVPIARTLARLPAGRYTIRGPTVGERGTAGTTTGTAWLTHDIPAGPRLLSPAPGARVPVDGVVTRWRPVSRTITGKPVRIIAYQLVVEEDAEPHPHMIGKRGLSMHLPPSTTRVELPAGVLRRGAAYTWEVLAIERSGNQTLSSGVFSTR